MELNARRGAPVRIITQLDGRRKHLRVCSGRCGHVVGGKYGGESAWSRIARHTETIRREPRLVAALDTSGDGGIT